MFFGRRPERVSWIVVFLGNPGPRYQYTRHNAGFMTADAIEKDAVVRISKVKFKSLTSVASFGNERVFLMKPQTYMNLSGDAIRQAMSFYKVPLDNVLAVSDDVSLPLGKLRVRRRGSAGGHNGLKDIIAKCGGEGFPRIKVGVGGPPKGVGDLADWVLSKLNPAEEKLLAEASQRAAQAVKTIITSGVDAAMEKYN